MENPRPAGRPKGTKRYPVIKQLRLSDQDAADLKRLAALWRCSEAEAMRRSVRDRLARVLEVRGRHPQSFPSEE